MFCTINPHLDSMEWGEDMQGRLREFARNDRAAMTIEFVLWVPIILGLLVTAVDATTLYVTQTEMWNVARDTARRMVTGKILTEADAEAYAASAPSLRDYPYSVDASYDKDGVVMVMIGISFNDLSIIGYGSPLVIFGTNVVARVTMRPDPRIPFGTAV